MSARDFDKKWHIVGNIVFWAIVVINAYLGIERICFAIRDYNPYILTRFLFFTMNIPYLSVILEIIGVCISVVISVLVAFIIRLLCFSIGKHLMLTELIANNSTVNNQTLTKINNQLGVLQRPTPKPQNARVEALSPKPEVTLPPQNDDDGFIFGPRPNN